MNSDPLDPNGVRTQLGHYIGVKSMTSIWKSVGDAASIDVRMAVDIQSTGAKFSIREAIYAMTRDR